MHIIHSFTQAAKEGPCHGWHICKQSLSAEQLGHAKVKIILTVQRQIYLEEIQCIKKEGHVLKQSPLVEEGKAQTRGKSANHHPWQTPCHLTAHQTLPRVSLPSREALDRRRFWVLGCRRKAICQQFDLPLCDMSLVARQTGRAEDGLPSDRLSIDPPFTFVGLDVFGPLSVTSRRTRGGLANSKHWAIIFTCMSVHAIHIEVIESMDSS